MPLAQRKSKWAVYAGGDTHKAKEEPEPEISGFAAAIQAAGGGGDPLSALARLGAGGDTEPRTRDDVPTATASALERWGEGASTAQGQRWTGADITNEVTAPFAAVVPTQQRRQVPLKPAAPPQNVVINPTELNLGFPSKDDLSALRVRSGVTAGSASATAKAYQTHFCGARRNDLHARLAFVREKMDGILGRKREGGGSVAARPGTDAELEEAKQLSHQLKRGDVCVYHAHCKLRLEEFREFGG